jgi:hypothetical protein
VMIAQLMEWGDSAAGFPYHCMCMRRIGSHSLAEFPSSVVRIDCERCGRAGSYRLDSFTSRTSLPNQCANRHAISR